MRTILILLACLLMSACGKQAVRPDAIPQAKDLLPVYIPTYVPIREELRQRCTWKKACRPSEGVDCAKQRGDCLGQYERQLDGIDAIQGKPVPR
ncbi:hypothetical protein [Lysobacter sp. Root96]|uniref:hypothetical protein n=1 Tax=Lysobacter sp. Root96 TaxID=1736612 RepID=UPI0006F6FA2A|nr:hypothetical protein [Lysobacter sp. Root96]KRD71434.1 hypothetical protein ASE45_06390 [Lysobacter sp. Root96]